MPLAGAPRGLLERFDLTEAAGLDPASRNQIWATVRGRVASGTTVLLTTQFLDEADQLADHIAVVDHRRVVAEGSPDVATDGMIGVVSALLMACCGLVVGWRPHRGVAATPWRPTPTGRWPCGVPAVVRAAHGRLRPAGGAPLPARCRPDHRRYRAVPAAIIGSGAPGGARTSGVMPRPPATAP